MSDDFIKNGFICVSVRKWRDIKDEEYIKYAKVISDFCDKISLNVLLIVMESHNDLAITKNIEEFFKVKTKILYAGIDMSGEELTGIISKSMITVSVRLHSLIFSACAGVPMIGLSYDPKVSSFMKLAGIDDKYIIDINEQSEASLCHALDALYEELSVEKERISSVMNDLRKSAQKNAEITSAYIIDKWREEK